MRTNLPVSQRQFHFPSDATLMSTTDTHSRDLIKEVVEMPDTQVDRVIRSFESNEGKLSNVLAREIPLLTQEGAWRDIEAAMRKAFDDGPSFDAVKLYKKH
ncbi:hypothetical protein MW290_04660 [Aquincola tertiaricarbonis]|uniref:Uncharacterized protein n=1 Tax=Aquincola tertiaricarbonis TaxID=391953 RepID=A0ABY4S362_AQUTE|nr:hypothetical protein [Aquincola tertiaricarbonis]URI07883.1 hypothetical protein MW290_04660 [Aquincola tertiaricarbonis]